MNVIQDCWCFGRELNASAPEYKQNCCRLHQVATFDESKEERKKLMEQNMRKIEKSEKRKFENFVKRYERRAVLVLDNI
jgi:hypothetical protein